MKQHFLPIKLILYTLVVLALGASASWNLNDPGLWFDSLRNFMLLLFSGWLMTVLLEHFHLGSKSRTEHRIITMFILFLLFDSLAPWWVFAALGAVTEGLQRLVRTPTGPLFNPAALGALALSFFGFFPSWWGTNFSPRISLILPEGISLAFFITLPLAGYVAYKYKKLWIPASATVMFFLAYSLLFRESPLFILLDGTLAFFFLVMAVEPKTSPNTQHEQILYGSIIGLLIPLGLIFHWLEAYLIALLAANLYTKRAFLKSLLD